VNSNPIQSASSDLTDEQNHSFLLNESNGAMDVDEEFINNGPTKINGHVSPPPSPPVENDLSRNPVLNKSFDVLPQANDETNDVLDTTVELPNHSDEFVETTSDAPPLLPVQVSLEYPFVVPQPVENVRSTSPELGQSMTMITNNINEKSFDTNTFVLKKKERRKLVTDEANVKVSSPPPPPPSAAVAAAVVAATTPSATIDTTNAPCTTLVDPTRIIECVEQYYRILYRVCECTEELKQELRHVKSERDQMSEDLIQAENAYTDVKKRNEKLKLIINEHKMNTETLKRFSEESVRYTEEQKQKYAVLKQHAQEKLNEANTEIERLRRVHASETEGIQAQLRYAQLRVQSLEQELKSVKQELEQKKKENIELTNICDELLATNKR